MGNASIVGFFGRSGHVVDAIGLYVNLARGPMEKQDLITKVGLWGGNSGQAHDLDVVPRRLISVVVRSGEVIDSLKFTYSDCDGHQHTAGPWGGSDASQSMNNHMILLGRSEVVKEVSGTIGPNSSVPDFVSSLLLATNTSSHGPFGEGRGIPFRIPVQDNDSIVGFFAQAEKHINAIGFYLESMEIKDNDGPPCANTKLEGDIKEPYMTCITKIGPWGANNHNYKDIEVAPLCLNSITIRSGDVVFSLAFSYSDNNGKQHHAGPWGASAGFSYGSFDTILLGPSEFLAEVSGTTGSSTQYSSDVVTSVMFITNARRYGPFGGGGGIPFHSPVLSNGSIVSFFANTGRVVDAIGVYVKPNDRGSTKEQDPVTKIGPWGGGSGRPSDVDVLPRRLISVVIHSGRVINSLMFTYSDCDGQQHSGGPWGGTANPLEGSSHTILLGQSDFLMEVSGTVGWNSENSDVVTSLYFVTNTGSYGPYGNGGGTRFRSPLRAMVVLSASLPMLET
ncbi:hypothetical protein CFC21_051179 [Triticum aestivum]|uniref:Jacalin-type lectin domain-containing protein n=2 Tax=Triticum aestivum TaxID=4565 RepID=A0A3B6KPI7_WHEAT|nr:mannose/glucose-specific lectin-like isoform X1 [Triticum aestivum]KAF7041369.1 hypothetical protein CFC21_051179 [Triticum aestivum]